MVWTLQIGSLKIFGGKFYTRKAFGISSVVKGVPESHYLLVDVDSRDCVDETGEYINRNYSPVSSYETREGHHWVIWEYFGFREAIRRLVGIPNIDLHHVAIGIRRGYWFLETHRPVGVPKGKKATYMVIERATRRNADLDGCAVRTIRDFVG